jgi:Protein of unknown function (DUF2950)
MEAHSMFRIHSQRIKGACLYHLSLLAVSLTLTLITLTASAWAVSGGQKTFTSPGEAVKGLITAAKTNDIAEMLAILGPDGKEIISTGDDVADKSARMRFLVTFDEFNGLEVENDAHATLIVGDEEWPFPIPIVKRGETWLFDTKKGKEEVLNRMIGRNELDTIEACYAYEEAQREYADTDWNYDGVLEYAQKIMSDKGKRNGLYWEAAEDEIMSPMGPLFADAIKEGYSPRKQGEKHTPFHGYFFKILKAQGKNAPGGAYSYIINGHMVAGFALVAYPAHYGSTGIMTFMINQNGTIYQKDLGKNSAKIAEGIRKFDPDKTWHKVF